MAGRADSFIQQTNGVVHMNGAGTQYLVRTPAGVLYCVFCDNANDLLFKKSSDGGLTWSVPTALASGITLVAHSVFYDRDAGIAAGLIHVAWIDSGAADVLYRSIDTAAADALSGTTTIFAGATTAAGGFLSLTRARGGRLGCIGSIDAGAEVFFATSADVGATWNPKALPGAPAIATQDQAILLPGFAADNQDLICIFWDASANQIFRYLYDDSADAWAATSISAGMTDTVAATSFPHFAATVDLANSRVILIAWTAVDTVNADLLCWTVTEAAITAKADVVTNSGDDQHLAGIGIDTETGYWYAFYAGKSDGSETVGTSLNVYVKVSQDAATTWGAETQITTLAANIRWLATIPRFVGAFACAFHLTSTFSEIRVNVSTRQPVARALVGL